MNSGKTVDRDQSGRGTRYHRSDGSSLWEVPRTSHLSVGFHPGRQQQVLTQHRVEGLCRRLA
ncbi:hypothetical protein ACFZB9_17810 [Kitasatospora sp. NPDC008050]|uniref:hypothetical protein n=1 Tax=Kitasatospora sp. NPDC008050 TaxID=3364021 RepID=UPI0036E293DB